MSITLNSRDHYGHSFVRFDEPDWEDAYAVTVKDSELAKNALCYINRDQAKQLRDWLTEQLAT